MSGRILVVDDKENIRKLFERMLGERFDIVTAGDGSEAIAKLALGSFDLVISDIRMPGADGLEVLKATRHLAPGTEVILMTAYATVQNAIDAMRAGAWDYLLKPFDPDDAVLKVEKAIEHKKLRDRAEELAAEARERHRFDQLLGRSQAMRRVFALLEKAAGFDLTVLLTGPSGTGKELAARAVHYASERRECRFVAVNCGAFPAELLESELFGHVRGAFTGAVSDKRGLIEEAAGGTLFLDEIGELPLPLQVKLNRALQEREYRRVGETRDRKVDARIVAATNVNLRAAVAEGRFREDLFYRLQVFPIALPAVRERPEDIPLLAAHFLERARERFGKAPNGFSAEAIQALCRYGWPGNVRELENAIDRAVVVCASDTIGPNDLSPEITEANGAVAADALANLRYRDALELLRDRAVRDYLTALLRATGGNVSKAAERAGVARESLHRLLKKHGVEPDAFRS
jgi:two-component system response regulator HydG